MSTRPINAAGLALIDNAEGDKLAAYPDPGTHGAPWTIGVGHTGPEVHPDMTITQAQSDALLQADLAKFCVAVTTLAPHTTDNQYAALVSFTFNVGAANLHSSALLRKHNAGDYAGAQAEFGKWDKAAGRTLPGLTKRRAAESLLYGTKG